MQQCDQNFYTFWQEEKLTDSSIYKHLYKYTFLYRQIYSSEHSQEESRCLRSSHTCLRWVPQSIHLQSHKSKAGHRPIKIFCGSVGKKAAWQGFSHAWWWWYAIIIWILVISLFVLLLPYLMLSEKLHLCLGHCHWRARPGSLAPGARSYASYIQSFYCNVLKLVSYFRAAAILANLYYSIKYK